MLAAPTLSLLLQAANVHAILESGPLVATVMLRLQDAISLINDLDENLHIFDIKLRHMREDIAAIEARNNRLAWLLKCSGAAGVLLRGC